MSNTPKAEGDAIACYILSKHQGVDMIAVLTGKTVREVKVLIKEGKRLLKERDEQEHRCLSNTLLGHLSIPPCPSPAQTPDGWLEANRWTKH